MAEREIERWVTSHGRRIPIFKGESKEDVAKRLKEGAQKGKESRPVSKEKKEKDVKAAQQEHRKASDEWHKKYNSYYKNPTPRRKAAEEKAGKALGEAGKNWTKAVKEKAIKSTKFNKTESKKAPAEDKKEPLSPRAQAENMNEQQLKDYIKKNGLQTEFNIMKNKRNGYGQPNKIRRDLVADHIAREEGRARRKAAENAGNNLKKETPSNNDIAGRMSSKLAAKGIKSEKDIENHLRNLSSTRRNRIAKEMGIEGRGEDKIKEMTRRLAGGPGDRKAEPAKKFDAKERTSYINNLSKLRNNGDKKDEDWRVVRQSLDNAPTGTVMISRGERGTETQYKKLEDGNWEYMTGPFKGDKRDSKTMSMGWAGHTGRSPEVEFTTEKAMKAKAERAKIATEKKMTKAADLPGVKSYKSALTRSGSTMYLDLDDKDMTPANIKQLEKKGWKRRGLGNGTWYYKGE